MKFFSNGNAFFDNLQIKFNLSVVLKKCLYLQFQIK